MWTIVAVAALKMLPPPSSSILLQRSAAEARQCSSPFSAQQALRLSPAAKDRLSALPQAFTSLKLRLYFHRRATRFKRSDAALFKTTMSTSNRRRRGHAITHNYLFAHVVVRTFPGSVQKTYEAAIFCPYTSR